MPLSTEVGDWHIYSPLVLKTSSGRPFLLLLTILSYLCTSQLDFCQKYKQLNWKAIFPL